MFEYAKEEINKTIREIENEISSKKEIEFNCKNSREHILSYLNIKNGIESFTRSTILGSLLGAVLIFLGCSMLVFYHY